MEVKTASELSDLVTNIEIKKEDGKIQLSAKYRPTVEHSEKFVELTQDINPIHRRHLELGQAIFPGMAHLSTAIGLSYKLMNETNVSHNDFPFWNAETKFTGLIVTSVEYDIQGEYDPQSNKVKITISQEGKPTAYTFTNTFQKDNKVKSPEEHLDFLYQSTFKTSHNGLHQFGKILNAGRERKLFAVSSSSSAPCEALEKGLLHLPKDRVVMYSDQQLLFDARDLRQELDLDKGLMLELFMSNDEQFGEIGKNLRMEVKAMRPDYSELYSIKSTLVFKDNRFVDVLMRSALRHRK